MFEFSIKRCFEVFDEKSKENFKYFMASIDVESVFTNTTLRVTIKIYYELLFRTTLSNLTNNDFAMLLRGSVSIIYFYLPNLMKILINKLTG